MNKIRKYWLPLTGACVGGLAGFFYWRYVGCAGGSCPITSSPFMSTLWGAMIFGLLFDMFRIRDKG